MLTFLQCVERFNESWKEVERCVDSEVGNQILKHMGSMTHNLRPSVSYIPTITIDGVSMRSIFFYLFIYRY